MATTTNFGLTKPTVGGDSDAWGGYLNTDLDVIDASLSGFAATFIGGLTLSTAGSSATFGIAAGTAGDASGAMMTLASAYTKTTSAWAVGTGNGGIDTGAVANSTWYHVYLIKRVDTGVVDVLFSLSASAPTMPTNYTLKRRIGSMKTNGSAQWVGFTQIGDEFTWSSNATSVLDVNYAPTGTQTAQTLNVPTGVKVKARVRGWTQCGASTTMYTMITSPEEVSNTGASSSYPATSATISGASSVGAQQAFTADIITNTSGQVNVTASPTDGSSLVRMSAYAWIDTRGKN